jgi:hypothetical protein
MKKHTRALLALMAPTCVACATFRHAPETLGAPQNAPAFGYTPIDPLNAEPPPAEGQTCPVSKQRMLDALPDVTMRIAVGSVSDSGHIRYGPATLGTSGSSYVVVLDYTLSQTKPKAIVVRDSTFRVLDPAQVQAFTDSQARSTQSEHSRLVYVPVYLGVGLRLTANVVVRNGTVDLGNLLAIGAAAQENRVSGTMVVQTLGISGAGVSALLPMPSDINTTTIQAAIQSLGAIKTKLYDDSTAKLFIRVIGYYNTLGDGQANAARFISSALSRPPVFYLPPCPTAPR